MLAIMHVACQIEADSCEIVSGVVGKIWKSNLQNSLLTQGIEKFATSKDQMSDAQTIIDICNAKKYQIIILSL